MLPNLRVLVIDDSDMILEGTSRILKQIGVDKISTALNVNDANKLLNDAFENNDPYQLILCDHHMPGSNGMDFLKKIRINMRFKDIPFITITSDSQRTTVLPYISLGADSFIVKPVNAEDLEAKITQVWKKKGQIK